MSHSPCDRTARRVFAIAGLLSACLIAFAAQAGKEDGNHLLETCDYREDRPPATGDARNTMAYEIGFCRGFILGVAGALTAQKGGYCEPEDIAYADLEKTVMAFLHAHPRRLTEHRRDLVSDALIAAHPCPK